jgi:hypothetical protein
MAADKSKNIARGGNVKRRHEGGEAIEDRQGQNQLRDPKLEHLRLPWRTQVSARQ